SKQKFLEAVRKAKKHIIDGEAFQIVLSQRFSINSPSNPFNVYRALRTTNPSPYMYYINFGKFKIIGSSPEPLIKINGRKILTCPIAGTKKRGIGSKEEKFLVNSLLNDEKEIAEHNMLVDLSRNDLGRVCKFESIKIKKYMSVEKYSHVIHLVSRIEGTLDKKSTIYDALKSTFPAGTLTGAPKIRAMQIISELEPDCRGPYGGVVGYFGYDGSLDTCITIRTAIIKDDKAYIQAGAGIVYDSVPENEWNETLNKAGALFKAIKLIN
ncbi:MAG: anthranilate synthase component I family protein, partial [Actinobacteria bacterium]|nr:anthranilate synthase component I family protein [Actinomycetota bacterium]